MTTKNTAAKKRAHTPGPWRVGDAKHTVFGPPNGNPSPQTIARLGVVDHEANGRLIAAAPELLAALELAQPFIEDLIMAEPTDKSYKPGLLLAVRKTLAAAIAKAEGK